MRTIEAGLGQPVGELDPSATLPPMVRGDLPAGGKLKHAWQGRLFSGLTYVTAIGLGCGAMGLTIASSLSLIGTGPVSIRGFVYAGMMAVGARLQWWLAEQVENFTR